MKFDRSHLSALTTTMLICAGGHLLLLFAVSLYRRDYEIVNLWNVLDIDLLIPGIEKGSFSFFLSYIAVGIVYALVYIWQKRK